MPIHLKQDISFEISNDRIVIFKSIFQDAVKTYKGKILQYIAEINNLLSDRKDVNNCFYFVGTLQKEFAKYRLSYQHASWLENYSKGNGGILFFYDYALEYLQGSIPLDVYEGIFSPYKETLDDFGKDVFINTLEAFYMNRMSISDTAKSLYLHRNTVLYRLKKIRQYIGIDPLSNIYDSQLLFQILHYYKFADR
jgi:Regulator of polyketide synthase expression